MQRTVFLTALSVLYSLIPGLAETTAPPVFTPDTGSIEIPFRYVDDELMIVQGSINGITGYILIDLGFEELILHAKYFNGRGKVAVLGPGGAGSNARLTPADLAIGGLHLHTPEAYVLDIEQFWNKGTPLIGLAGWQLFQGKTLTIDRDARMLYVAEVRPDDREPNIVLPFSWNGPIPYIEVEIADKTYRFSIDTGAESNVIGRHAARKASLAATETSRDEIHGFGGTRGVPRVVIGAIDTDHLLTDQSFLVLPLLMNAELPGTRIDGILGGQWLKQYARVSFDFARQRLILHGDVSTLAAQD